MALLPPKIKIMSSQIAQKNTMKSVRTP